MIVCNGEDVDKFLDENDRVMIMFGATWCGPCKTLKPKFQTLAGENTDIPFIYCDIEETEDLASDLKIQSVPTIVSFTKGVESETAVGPSVDRIRAMITSLRALSV